METMNKTSGLFTNIRRGALGLMAGSTAMSAMPHLPEAKAEDPPPPPNIILILADDLGWTDINCKYDGGTICDRDSSDGKNDGGEFDSNFYFTPNIAQLRKNGMRFTNFYACFPVCTGTRGCIMTGKYPARTAVTWGFNGAKKPSGETIIGAFSENQFPLDEVTIAEALKSKPEDTDSYYVTAHVGKWHLSGDYSYPGWNALWPSVPEHGFDYSIHMRQPYNGYWEYKHNTDWWDLWIDTAGLRGRPALCGMTGGDDWGTLWGDPDPSDPNEYLTDSFTTKAIKFLDKWDQEYRSEGRPFFLYLPHFAPHDPLEAPQSYIDSFKDCSNYPDERHDNRSKYAAMIYSLDESIETIRKYLEDELGTDVANNTVIIFTSDNGGSEYNKVTDNDPLREGKGWIYEGGVRVPLIVYWPGVTEPNSTCDFPVTSADFWPTFIEMGGISMDDVEGAYDQFDKATIDGMDITDLLEGQTVTRDYFDTPTNPNDDNAVFFSYEGIQFGVRQGDFKLIKKYDKNYDWPNDFNTGTETDQLKYDPPKEASFELYKIGVGGSYNWDPCGQKDGALELDGVVGHAVIPQYKGVTGGDARTCCAWIKTNSGGDIISWGDPSEPNTKQVWLFYIKNNGELRLLTWGGESHVTGSINLCDNNWHHVAVTYDNSASPRVVLYVDGVEDEDRTGDISVDTDEFMNVKIGLLMEDNHRYFNGFIDDVRIYARAFDPCEIRDLHDDNDPCLDTDPCLVGYWKLDETEGTKVSDDSGNERDGILLGDVYEGLDLHEDPCYSDEGDQLDDLLIKWLEHVDAGMIRPIARIGDNLYEGIQHAIDNATNNDEILVYPCIYKESIDFGDLTNVTIRSVDPCDPKIVEDTIIWGDGGSVVTFGTANCTLKGLTITAGNDPCGGGIYGGGDPCSTISMCVIRDNHAATGGGIYNFDGTIENCTIIDNNSLNGGGLADCDGTIRNCIIADNIATTSGGGLYNCNPAAGNSITNCTITDNIAKATRGTNSGAGGLKNCGGDIINCIIWGNADATNTDGANEDAQIHSDSGGPTVTYSCIQDANSVDQNVYPGEGNIDDDPCFVNSRDSYDKTTGERPTNATSYFYREIEVENDYPVGTIIEIGNDGVLRKVIADPCGVSDPCGVIVTFHPPISPAVDPCTIIYIWPEGTTNVREDYHLQAGSACIDVGDPCGVYTGQVDVDGDDRLIDIPDIGNGVNDVDIGADEYGRVKNITKKRQYEDINDAIDDANDGDILVANPSTYEENINFDGKEITVRSTDPCDWDVVEATIIDGNDLDSVVRFDGTETSDCKLSGFTITNGYGPADEDGGGITGQGSATITNCIIRDNVAQRHGGGIRGNNGFYGLIDRCIITGNSAVNRNAGGLAGCHGTISNCLIYNNTATLSGGGMVNCDGDIINCTIADNTAGISGGGIGACTGTITNCIVWGNDPNQLVDSSTPTYSCIQNWSAGGTGNISADPDFVDPCDPCEPDYHLQISSPCINAGDPCYNPSDGETDIDGDPRVLGGRVDMGGDETKRVHNITKDKWYWYINEAIDDATGGDELVAIEDEYEENVDFDGKAITVRSSDPCDPCTVSSTIIDANDVGRVVDFDSSEGSNSILKGFTITGGYINTGGPNGEGFGGGIRCKQSSPTITNCIITDNQAICGGSIGCFDGADPTIKNCIINANNATSSGGGIFCGISSDPQIYNCTLVSNTANSGGGVWAIPAGPYVANPTITNCIIWDNGDDLSLPSGCEATYSCIQDIDPGEGNIVGDPNDPLFINPNDGNYCLGYGSPCIDAANGNVDPPTDIFGQARIDDPNTPNTGIGDPNYVDMGAHEYDPN